jgi:hypothetical protein
MTALALTLILTPFLMALFYRVTLGALARATTSTQQRKTR